MAPKGGEERRGEGAQIGSYAFNQALFGLPPLPAHVFLSMEANKKDGSHFLGPFRPTRLLFWAPKMPVGQRSFKVRVFRGRRVRFGEAKWLWLKNMCPLFGPLNRNKDQNLRTPSYL